MVGDPGGVWGRLEDAEWNKLAGAGGEEAAAPGGALEVRWQRVLPRLWALMMRGDILCGQGTASCSQGVHRRGGAGVGGRV